MCIGVDGTDREINKGSYGTAPENSSYLILGHEALAQVSEVGNQVQGFSHGDLVVPTVRRPCSTNCLNCSVGEMSACLTGEYFERGIFRLHGFASEYTISDADFLVKIPAEIKDSAVLLEPLSVVERAVSHIFNMQKRIAWQPKQALVLGIGPLGILTTTILRLRGLDVYCAGREEEDSLKANIVSSVGAFYKNTKENLLHKMEGSLDIVVDATGCMDVVVDAAHLVGLNGFFCFLGICNEQEMLQNAGRALTKMVLGNRVIMGSVNSDKPHFETGLNDMIEIKRKYPDLLDRMITEKVPIENFKKAFEPKKDQIKQIIGFQ